MAHNEQIFTPQYIVEDILDRVGYYIIGNNTNKGNPKPPKYLGALVGQPDNTNNYSKMKINGRAIWVCENLIDYD